jgi:hypothetical protein
VSREEGSPNLKLAKVIVSTVVTFADGDQLCCDAGKVGCQVHEPLAAYPQLALAS